MVNNQIDRNIQLDDSNNTEIDLSALLHFLVSKWLTILVSTVIGALVGFSYSKFLVTPKYEATSKIYIVNTSDESQVNLSDLQVGTNLVNDYISLMRNRTMIDSVITNLDLQYNYDQLNKMINVSNPVNTRELNLSVISPSPEESQNIANELAKQAIEYLPTITGAKAPSLVEKAVFPETSVIPKTGRNTLYGGIAGFVLAVGYYTIRFILNDSYRGPDDIQKAYGVMPLASIPEDTKNSGSKKKRKK